MMKKFAVQLIKPVFIIATIIIFCSLLAKFVLSGETILEYSERNPVELVASPKPEAEAEPSISPVEVMEEQDNDEPLLDDELVFDEDDDADEIDLFVSIWSVPENMIVFQPGFSKEPINDNLFSYIKGISFPITLEEAFALFYGDDFDIIFDDDTMEDEFEELYAVLPNIVENADDIAISRDDLMFLSMLHYDFDGVVQVGEMICNALIADDLLAIFYELYLNEYQLERISLIEEYGGSDTFSMIYNNSHSFNYRNSSPGRLSLHAYGFAVDVNPFNNPYVAYNNNGTIRKISPVGSEEFADRSRNFPHKIDHNDLLYILFDKHGFFWGGNWNFQKDYHHFQKDLR